MRKILAVAAALVMSAAAIAPAQAVTAGQKCATKLAIAKSGTTKLYCGKNTVKATAKTKPLIWKKNAMCYDGVVVMQENAKSVADTQTQLDQLNAQVAALPTGASTDVMRTSLTSLATELAQGLTDLKAGQAQLKKQLLGYCS